ncbi:MULTISPECIES: hypothetical protein [Pseudochrobactrum]|nr:MULTISPECIES: hypothetical protein [Pseudochrobactrum]
MPGFLFSRAKTRPAHQKVKFLVIDFLFILVPNYRNRRDIMPFQKTDYLGIYKPEQIKTLQTAYNEVCEILGYCPTTDENKDQLARTVIRIYESGIKDPKEIAGLIARIENLRS